MKAMLCTPLRHRTFFFLHRWLSLSLILEACAFLWKTSASGYGFAIEELFPFAIFMLWGLGLFMGKIAIVCFFAAMLLRFPRASCSPPGERPISPLGQAVIWFGLLLCLLFRVFSTMDPLVSLLVSCAEFGLFLYASWDVKYLSPK